MSDLTESQRARQRSWQKKLGEARLAILLGGSIGGGAILLSWPPVWTAIYRFFGA